MSTRTARASDGRAPRANSESRVARTLLAALAAICLVLPAGSQDAAGTDAPAESAPVATPAPVDASGSADGLAPADGLENWSGSLDLSTLKPGKYNVVVEGVDAAGNVLRPEPINVFVDPASDFPNVNIVNPFPLMRAGGDFNVVGTCADDDGVARVEVSLDGGEFVAASGGAFWSYALETAELADGRRVLAVRGVDINGLVGPETRVSFDLDRTKPLAAIEDPVPGSIVAGKRVLQGSAFDANNVRSVEYSLDDRVTWTALALKQGKDRTKAGFSIPVDTAKLPDGPLVVWLRSVDDVGSTEMSASLVYVDNTKPAIEIARPLGDLAVNGSFALVGAARDEVGVTSLSVAFAGVELGEIPLVPGNPYFMKVLDASAVKGDKAELVLSARDRIGNLTRLSMQVKVDAKADLPVVSVRHPEPEGMLRAGEPLRGAIADDDGVSALRWSLDGAAPVEIPASEAWSLELPDTAPSGARTLSLVPVDSNGLAGAPLVLKFTLDRGPGTVRFERLASASGSRDFAQGAEVRTDGGEFLEGSVFAPNGLASLRLVVGGAEPRVLAPAKPDSSGEVPFRIALDRSLPYGFAPLTLEAEDAYGNAWAGKALLYVVNYGAVREETGFRFVDPAVGAPEGDGPGRFTLAGAPVFGAFHGAPLASIGFEPATDLVRASFDGSSVRVEALKEGVTAPTMIVGRTEKGHVFKAGPYVFATDSEPPLVTLEATGFPWSAKAPVLRGAARDGNRVAEATWRVLPSGEARPLTLKADGSFELAVPAADLAPGAVSILVEAADAAGNRGRASASFGFDPDAPRVRFLSPASGDEVYGAEDLAALVEDVSGVAKVEFAADGSRFEEIPFTDRFFIHRADLAADAKAAYRVTDRAGNATLARPEVSVAAKPRGEALADVVSVEGGGDLGRLELAGTAGARKLSFSSPLLAETEFASLPADALPAPVPARLLLSGASSLKGQVSVAGLLKAVSVSYDGGATYLPLGSFKDEKSAKPALAVSLSADTLKTADGALRWIVKVEDFSGAVLFAPLYLRVDNTPPELRQVFPESAQTTTGGSSPAVFRAVDATELASLEFKAGAAAPAAVEAGGSRWFARRIDPASEKGGALVLAVSARDRAGNVARLEYRAAYDAAADAPVVSPALPEGTLDPGTMLSLQASDDDAPPATSFALDSLAPFAEGGPALAAALPETSAGRHTLVMAAVDPSGKRTELRREILVGGPAPGFNALAAGDAKAPSPVVHGAALTLAPAMALSGTVSAPNGLASVELSLDGGAPLKASLGKPAAPGDPVPFTVALPSGLKPQRILFELRATDAAGLSALSRFELHGVIPPTAGEDDAEGVRFHETAFDDQGGTPRARLAVGEALTGRFKGRPIASVALDPPRANLSASFDGFTLRVEALAEEIGVPGTLKVRTVDGEVFEYGPFVIDVDEAAPALELAGPAQFEWTKGAFRLKGSASDRNGLSSLSVALAGGEAVELLAAPRPGADPFAFDREITLATVPDGAVDVRVVATDLSGARTVAHRMINKDTLPPELVQVIPAPGTAVNGTTTVVVEARDSGRLALATYRDGPAAEAEALEGPAVWARGFDFSRLALPLPEGGGFSAADKAGNVAVLAPDLAVDAEKDKPVAAIQTPVELEVLRGDFSIAGVAYDDDGLAAIHYSVDSGDWVRLPMEGTSFTLRVALADTTDNEHTVELRAEDIYGIQGEVVKRTYRISKEEPVAAFVEPSIEKPARGVVRISGTAADANGIGGIAISVDNRATYNAAPGAEAWSYLLDTSALADGLHAVAARPVDNYGTEGFHASILNIDNTPPRARLDLPADGAEIARSLLASGRIGDNLALASARIEISPLGAASPPLMVVEVPLDSSVRKTIDLSALKPGPYAVRLVARDRADNETVASRTIHLKGGEPADTVEILYPLPGSRVSGSLDIHGRAVVEGGAGTVTIFAGDRELGVVEPDPLGWFSLRPDPDTLPEGEFDLKAGTRSASGKALDSRPSAVSWTRLGPWISIESHRAGAWLPYRPFLEGKAGWAEIAPDPADKEAVAAFKKSAKERAPVLVEASIDNGRNWSEASGTSAWKFRLETQDYPEGEVRLIVRATFGDGSVSVAKTTLLLDKTPPTVEIEKPVVDGRYNASLSLSGSAADANGLREVRIGLRKGDKSSYELPSFIQGLYVDAHMLGGTLWEAGLGLTFFDDNVKLQGLFGMAPETDSAGVQQSFFGMVYGAKLIANIAFVPFGSFLGPDWDWLSLNAGLGANFSYFSETQSEGGLLVAAVFGQLEFPKVTLRNATMFGSYAFYTEMQVWVLSSVVSGGFIPRLSFGLRANVF